MNVQEREQAACHYIDAMAQDLRRLGSYLHQHPELGRQEHKAVEAIRAYLQTYGFQVEVGLSD